MLPLALALASKQHIVLLLPLLALWPPFGWRRTADRDRPGRSPVAPWFLASPADFWHDTVTELRALLADPDVEHALPGRRCTSWHRRPPFWLTGLVVARPWSWSPWPSVRRRPTGLGQLLRWCALVLFAANLVNKQAFYNQFWLVAALVLLSVAVPRVRLTPGRAR